MKRFGDATCVERRWVMGLAESKPRDLGSDRGYRVALWFQNGKLWGIPPVFLKSAQVVLNL
jgi:hypothetical protein